MTTTLSLIGIAAVAWLVPAAASAETFMGYQCRGDCSGHVAGYDWAADEEADEIGDCYAAKSRSFAEGCLAYLDEKTGDDGASDGRMLPAARKDFRKAIMNGGGEALREYSTDCWRNTGSFVATNRDLTFSETCFYVDYWAAPVAGSDARGYFTERQAIVRANRNLVAMGIGNGMREAILATWIRQGKAARPSE